MVNCIRKSSAALEAEEECDFRPQRLYELPEHSRMYEVELCVFPVLSDVK